MKARANRAALAAMLGSAARVAGSGKMIALLSHVLLTADDGKITAQATDGELTVSLHIDAEVEQPGAVLVTKDAAQVVRAMAGEHVGLEMDGEQLVITAGRSRFALATMPRAQFPELPQPVAEGATYDDAFTPLLGRVLFAASKDASLPVLGGVRVSRAGGTAKLAATDSYRLATVEAPDDGADAPEAIIPARGITEAARMLPKGEAGTLIVGDGTATFYAPGGALTARLIDGQFPNVEQIIGGLKPEATCIVNRAALLEAVGRIGLVAGKDGSPVRLGFGAGRIALGATGAVGQGEEAVEASHSGDEMVLGLNPAYLLDALKALGCEEVGIGLSAPLRPVIVYDGDDGLRQILMPVRLGE